MNSTTLLALKNNTKYQILSENIICSINNLFNMSNAIVKKKSNKNKINIIKNTNFQQTKNKFENKIIMILNKVSNDNIDKLIIEFLENITIDTIEEYNMIQTIIFNKIIREIDMIDSYYKFMIIIFQIMYYKFNFEPYYFTLLIENFILHCYNNTILSDEFAFLQDYNDETIRCNVIKIIKLLLHYNFFNYELKNIITDILFNQHKFNIDISCWFSNDNQYIELYKEQLVERINNCSSFREKILLENLFSQTSVVTVNHTNINDNMTNELEILMDNIIEEYMYFKSLDDITEFINEYCNNPDDKNIFCSLLINHYFKSEDNNSILTLFTILIKNKVIFKSNISRGLTIYCKDNDTINNDKMKQLLLFLKSNNITKNIEHIFKKYKIKTFYKVE